ncbi:hypothetical protein M316_0072 [Nitrincola phage 1M3-16]|nr:hypothetical protein GJ22_gp080 [Nitrincola phage 1M3-16]AHX01137.1 hypothetical protein M316_0072 [Nitrincola phage 1M3-16]
MHTNTGFERSEKPMKMKQREYADRYERKVSKKMRDRKRSKKGDWA